MAEEGDDMPKTRILNEHPWRSGREADAEAIFMAALPHLRAALGTPLRSAGASLLWAAAAMGHEQARDRLTDERMRWSQWEH